MSKYIYKSYNVTILFYYFVFLAKYRRAVLDDKVGKKVKEICLEIDKRYEVKFIEIGTDKDHFYFLVRFVLNLQDNKNNQNYKKHYS